MSGIRTIIECSNRMLTGISAQGRVCARARTANVRLNLGCGLTVAPGWINIDGSINAFIATLPGAVHRVFYRWSGARRHYSRDAYCRLLSEHVFLHHDLTRGIPFRDGQAAYIYTSHFLEHLDRDQAVALIAECYRVMQRNGRLRISVPDLAYVISLYNEGRKAEMLNNYFFVEDAGSHFARHKYMYDFDMLSDMLRSHGFRDVERCTFRHGGVPDLDFLDNRPHESLFVEARK